MKLVLPIAAIVLCCSCQSNVQSNEVVAAAPQVEATDTVVPEKQPYEPVAPPFKPISANFSTTDFLLPEGFSYKILFQEKVNQVVRADGQSFNAKGAHDLNVFIPDPNNPNQGQMYTGHETRYKDAGLGDGGGGTFYDVALTENEWNVTSPFRHVDFSKVGNTNRNCGGTITPHGTILSAEESAPWTNKGIWYRGKGHQDTTDFNGRSKHLNFGWMVEIDPGSGEVLHKLWAMGRFMHEDAQCMADGKTVYLSDDYNPAVFFKFVADQPHDYTAGQLYAYQQGEAGVGGSWITLPRDSASLLHIRDTAIARGATMFIRHEWFVEHDGKIIISETGDDDFDWADHLDAGGRAAHYIQQNLHVEGTKYNDTHGRVLVFDPETNQMDVLLEGGVSPTDSTTVFSNPDCNTIVEMNGTTWLVLNEDINWHTRNRVGEPAASNKQFFNEVYWLDLNLENPTLDDLHRFAIGPKGSETSGGIFTPDGKSYFVNLMHPWPRNAAPMNRSCTVVVRGFE